MSDQSNEPGSGLSRRDALKRGAAVGGALWVAPLVTATPAFGAEGSDGKIPGPCILSFVKYGDPDTPALDFTPPFDEGPGDWEANANPNYDLACLPEYAPGGSTPARGGEGDTSAWAPRGVGVVHTYNSDIYVEKWTAIDNGSGGGQAGTAVNFTATIYPPTDPDGARLEILVEGAELRAAIRKQSNDCFDDVIIDGQTAISRFPGNQISHLTLVICVPGPLVTA